MRFLKIRLQGDRTKSQVAYCLHPVSASGAFVYQNPCPLYIIWPGDFRPRLSA